jgi:hypothetical protein
VCQGFLFGLDVIEESFGTFKKPFGLKNSHIYRIFWNVWWQYQEFPVAHSGVIVAVSGN